MAAPTSEALERVARELRDTRDDIRATRRAYRWLAVVMAAWAITGGVLLWELHDQDRDSCADDNRLRNATAAGFDQQRLVLLSASQANDTTPPTEDEQRAIDAYNQGIDDLIARFEPVDC